MEFWFSELHTDNVKLTIRIEKQLFSGESEYQKIDVFDSEEFGKFISLDGEIVFSEKDEFIYDEMVTHVPMAVHPHVKDVLIIGGGDGGVAKELLQYDSVEHIDVVEVDKMFVDVSRQFFPEVACALEDPRVLLYLHGGGYVAGSIRYAAGFAGVIAAKTGVRTLCIAYRLAPEHPFPAALDDAMTAYQYLLGQGYHGSDITLIGESAGGGLILSLCLLLKAQGIPLPTRLVAISPWTDLTLSGESMEENREVDISLTKSELAAYAACYAPEQAALSLG